MKVIAAISVAKLILPCVTGQSSHYDFSYWMLYSLDRVPFSIERRSEQSNRGTTITKEEVLDKFPEEALRHRRSLAFGDYVDPSFSCPATTTCANVCVASINDCPEDALCPGTHPDDDGNPDHTYEVRHDF